MNASPSLKPDPNCDHAEPVPGTRYCACEAAEFTPATEAEKFRAEAAAHRAERARSQRDSDTDGFLSQWASGICARVAEVNAQIAENGGQWMFWRWNVTDLNGNTLNFRRVNTKFGFKLVVEHPSGDLWIDPNAKRPGTNRAKGVIVEQVPFMAEAHAATWAPPGARGLSGASQVSVRIFPNDRKLAWDGTAGPNFFRPSAP